MSILAETDEIKQLLQNQGIDSETLEDIHPIRVQPSRVLSHIYARLGKMSTNKKTLHIVFNRRIIMQCILFFICLMVLCETHICMMLKDVIKDLV